MKQRAKQIHRCDSCDAELSTKRRFCDERCRQLNEVKKVSAKKYTSAVAKTCQKMIRAEAAAKPTGLARAVINGELKWVLRHVGECVCVTCGAVKPWNHKGMHAGHWIGRVWQSTLFEPNNLACQCDGCNQYRHGAPHEYEQWMLWVRGRETMDRLIRLKHETKSFTCDKLVDMRIEFNRRLKIAIAKMKGTS